VICSKCRHENPAGNRFCGECGTRLRTSEVTVDPDAPSVRWLKAMDERKPEAPEAAAVTSAEAEAAQREREVAERAERAARRERELARRAEAERAREAEAPRTTEYRNHTVGGPSFLGLNESYPQQSPEEIREEDRSDIYSGGRSYSRALWLLAVLVVVAGLVFLQWRHSDELQALPPAQKAPAPPSETVAEDQETRQEDALTKPEEGAADSQDASKAAQTSPADAKSQPGSAPATEAEKPNSAATSPAPQQPTAEESASADKRTRPETAKAKSSPAVRAEEEATDGSDEPVRLAERYLMGRGVPQSCPTATDILREAANRGNYRAQIKLGALYATGNCVSLDRVQAYRFFTRALQSKPTNTWVEQNRSMLWAQMSDQERRQATEQSF
jgi:hypothetical protein